MFRFCGDHRRTTPSFPVRTEIFSSKDIQILMQETRTNSRLTLLSCWLGIVSGSFSAISNKFRFQLSEPSLHLD